MTPDSRQRWPESLESLAGRRVSVLGAARSGTAAANLLAGAGARVCLSDLLPAERLADRIAGLDSSVRVVAGRNDLTYDDLIVVSPGIPPAAPIWRAIEATGAPVISEIELGYLAASAPVLAVTGTDGKTTTASLAAAVCAAAGRPYRLLGNIGDPLCTQVQEVGPDGVLVVEVSCFQLLHVRRFRPRVAVLLNLAEDHLDYHPNFEHYVEAKLRVFGQQGAGDTAVLSADDPGVQAHPPRLAAGIARRSFSAYGPVDAGVGLLDGWLVRFVPGRPPARLMERDACSLLGSHNTENLAAAAAATLALGLAPEAVAAGFRGFDNLPHRLEAVRTLEGVRWINDSKATNPHAAQAGLLALPGEPALWLVAGGVDKGLDLAAWARSIVARAAGVILIGELAPRLGRALAEAGAQSDGGAPTVEEAPSLQAAVLRLRQLAQPGSLVLLGPGCSSFDMFRSYEHRGDVFRQLVQELPAAD